MTSRIDEINIALQNGFLPACLNFSIDTQQEANEIGGYEWNKMIYNSFYRTYECTESRFPPGHEFIPGFDKVIEMCIPQKSPLEELMERAREKLNSDDDTEEEIKEEKKE